MLREIIQEYYNILEEKMNGVLGLSLQGHPFLLRKKREGLHLYYTTRLYFWYKVC